MDAAIERRQSLSQEQLDRATEMAEGLILRERYSYSAYKAKLILLLSKEAVFQEVIDDDEVNDLLDEMASFDMTRNTAVRKEAFLVARTNSRIDRLEEELDYLDTDLMEIDMELEYLEEGSDEEEYLLEEAAASDLSASELQQLEQRLKSSRVEYPEDYWKRLRF